MAYFKTRILTLEKFYVLLKYSLVRKGTLTCEVLYFELSCHRYKKGKDKAVALHKGSLETCSYTSGCAPRGMFYILKSFSPFLGWLKICLFY